ncbi:MAG: hypothetical protein V5A18_09035 [Haloarculaceae archaeon]
MIENPLRSIPVTAVAVLLLVTAFTGLSAADNDRLESDHEVIVPEPVAVNTPVALFGDATNEETATRVGKAFRKAKKAFHGGRQDIQAIKKGDESPVEDVPTFFDGEDEADDNSDDENWQDGSDPEVST